jgi:uncharacterized coiled-coil protein SlyX
MRVDAGEISPLDDDIMLEGKIAEMEGKIAEVEAKIAGLEGKIAKVEAGIAEQEAELASTGMSKVSISNPSSCSYPSIVQLSDLEKLLRDEEMFLRDKKKLLLQRLARLEGGASATAVCARPAPGPRPTTSLSAHLCVRATTRAAREIVSRTMLPLCPAPAPAACSLPVSLISLTIFFLLSPFCASVGICAHPPPRISCNPLRWFTSCQL